MATLTIKPGVATQDVTDIENIIKSIDQDMLILDNTFNKLIPDTIEPVDYGVVTDWAIDLKGVWKRCYENSVKGVMAEIQDSATALQRAVNEALEYNKGAS